MLQNHLLQLLCLMAMEPPAQFDPSAVRNEKIKVLRSLRPIEAATPPAHSVAGQYTAGAIDGVAVPGYRKNWAAAAAPRPSSPCARTSTTGAGPACRSTCAPASACPARSTEIYMQFRAVPYSIFGGEPPRHASPTRLLIRLQPEERIELDLMSKTPGLDRSGLQLCAGRRWTWTCTTTSPARASAPPTSACTWTRSKATAPCSCAATKPKRPGSGSTRIARRLARSRHDAEALPGRHLGPGRCGLADRAPRPQLAGVKRRACRGSNMTHADVGALVAPRRRRVRRCLPPSRDLDARGQRAGWRWRADARRCRCYAQLAAVARLVGVVTAIPTDERWVPHDHPACNLRAVARGLRRGARHPLANPLTRDRTATKPARLRRRAPARAESAAVRCGAAGHGRRWALRLAVPGRGQPGAKALAMDARRRPPSPPCPIRCRRKRRSRGSA